MLRDTQLRNAREEDVRRLAKFCEIEKWDVLPKPVLIDELCWKGIVQESGRYGWY